MVQNFHLPPVGYGPGSQPNPEGELQYMEMPQDMRTFSPRLPEVEDVNALTPALILLAEVAEAAARVARTGAPERFDLAPLDAANRALVAETMGEGEVAMKIRGLPAIRAQESVFAGIWVLSGAGLDVIEVGRRARAGPAAAPSNPSAPGLTTAPAPAWSTPRRCWPS